VKGVSSRVHGKRGVEASAYDVIVKKVENLEREIGRLRDLILFRSESLVKPKRVSLRGMAKLLVSVDELEKGIEEAKSAIFRHELK
jgi:hypothetical protein